ncbi:MAG: type II toxin-antitoxin system Phd/YefM family antitoxin [Kiritimatiellae bacterium]|nr:type II toxin-antitoxin system Phd/YefM family antitoxin [Kiritimatiellia bacterium]
MTWALQDAKNKFSAVADTAANGTPQVVTRRGHPLVVVISYAMFREKIAPEPSSNIADAFKSCPVDVDFDTLIPPRRTSSGRGHKTRLFQEK